MKITVHLTRLDLVVLGWKVMFRMRANQYSLVAAWIFVFVVSLQETETLSMGDIGNAAGGALIGVAAAMLVCPIFYSVYVLLAPLRNKSVLGRHDFTLSPAEFQEATDVNESRYRWLAIPAIFRLRHCLVIQVNGFAVCPIPHRAFDSDWDYEAFCVYAENAWGMAKLAPGKSSEKSAPSRKARAELASG